MQSFFVLYEDEFEQSERVARRKKRHFVITICEAMLIYVQLWQVNVSLHQKNFVYKLALTSMV